MCVKKDKMAFSLVDRIKKGDEETVIAILQNTKCSNVDLQNGSALFWACVKGYFEIVKLLIQKGDNVNAKNAWQSTPLHAASDANRPDIVRYLINHGADIDARSVSGDTPCHLAAYRGYQQVVQILIENGTSITILNDKRRTCVQEAVHSGNENLIYYMQTVYDILSINNTKNSKTVSESEQFDFNQHRPDCNSSQRNSLESLISNDQSGSSMLTTSSDSPSSQYHFESSDSSSSFGNSFSTNATYGSNNSEKCVCDRFSTVSKCESHVNFGHTGGSEDNQVVLPREPTESVDFSFNDDSSVQNDLSLGRSSPPIRLSYWNIFT